MGAAACAREGPNGQKTAWTYRFRPTPARKNEPIPTPQRTDLSSIVLALQKAVELYRNVGRHTRSAVEIRTSSRFVIGYMTIRKQTVIGNGFRNQRGGLLPFRDLLEQAYGLHDQLERHGSVTYTLISKDENGYVRGVARDALDEMDREVNGLTLLDTNIGAQGALIPALVGRKQDVGESDEEVWYSAGEGE